MVKRHLTLPNIEAFFRLTIDILLIKCGSNFVGNYASRFRNISNNDSLSHWHAMGHSRNRAESCFMQYFQTVLEQRPIEFVFFCSESNQTPSENFSEGHTRTTYN